MITEPNNDKISTEINFKVDSVQYDIHNFKRFFLCIKNLVLV
jgi:hypothetical protein